MTVTRDIRLDKESVIIIGAGPAGLTAALELCRRSNLKPIILEKASYVGGLATTYNYKGNLLDLGGHRFFSKSTRVMDWWQSILPLASAQSANTISYHGATVPIGNVASDSPLNPNHACFLLRPRHSRILFNGELLAYPLKLDLGIVRALGMPELIRVIFDYVAAKLRPIRPEVSLEEFFINRFGLRLYQTFFKSYTEKVWGEQCTNLSAAWGAQRIKGLSTGRAVLHAAQRLLPSCIQGRSAAETSLIEHFLYPTRGPGELWEQVAAEIRAHGGEIRLNCSLQSLILRENTILSVRASNSEGESTEYSGACRYLSTMPIRELVAAIDGEIPAPVRNASEALRYRDFMIVGLLYRQLAPAAHWRNAAGPVFLKDNWIYVQDSHVQVGRLQFLNNWSRSMLADPRTAWVGMEYFVDQGSTLWQLPEERLKEFAHRELRQLGFVGMSAPLDAVVVRVEKAYPVYSVQHQLDPCIREFLDGIHNLFPIGRNGMHRYNNQDHSMLTGMLCVDQILQGNIDREALWNINTEQEYQE